MILCNSIETIGYAQYLPSIRNFYLPNKIIIPYISAKHKLCKRNGQQKKTTVSDLSLIQNPSDEKR